MKAEIRIVTPEQAKFWLGSNDKNRKIRTHRVRQYVDAIARGEWVVTNDAICIADTGRLLNGQHRLIAVMNGEASVEMLVLEGLPERNFHAMDCGVARTGGDLFASGGVSYPNQCSAVANLLWAWTNTDKPLGTPPHVDTGRPTRVQLQDVYLEYKDEIDRAVRTCVRYGLSRLRTTTQTALVDVVLQLTHGVDTEIWWDLVSPGYEGGLAKGHPARTLRDQLQLLPANQRMEGDQGVQRLGQGPIDGSSDLAARGRDTRRG